MKNEFSEEQQKWYMANMYMYLHYHPTNEFPINLENIWKILGFANKGNAKTCVKSNFVEKDDYQEVFVATQKNSHGGRPKETITLNIDTFYVC